MIKLFTFIKDEIEVIEDWLRYHSHLFGSNNITVIDHMSTDGTFKILNEWKLKGVSVYRTSVPFTDKHKVLSSYMNTHKRGFLVPIDADEFIAVKKNNQLTCDISDIRSELSKLKKGPFRYKFQQIDAIPSKVVLNDPLTEINQFKTKWYKDWKLYAKTFYDASFFVNTDQGNHKGSVRGHGKNYETNMTIVHYDVRDYGHFVKKNERGARAYNHTKSKKLKHSHGKHYHRRYWAIQEGRGIQQMIKEFGSIGNFNTNEISKKIISLR